MTTLTMRYSATPEGQMEEDLNRLRGISSRDEFVRLLDGIVKDTLTEDFWNITLPNDLATSSARSPALFAYNAALNLLGARVLFSKLKVSELLDPTIRAKKAPVERHHLFPKGYLKKVGIKDNKDINQIANFAYVEWQINIDIQDDPPPRYVPQHLKPYSVQELEKMSYWHALPKDWEHMDYLEFLGKRRKLIAQVVRDGFAELER